MELDMKTEEDEAFDDLARKQGDWGGGYQAKRKMAADKLQELWNEDEWRKNNWRCGHGWLRGEQCEICNAAQPAQEPVAWTLLLTGEHHGIIGEAGEKFIGAPECYQRVNVYTTPPKREWVGLTPEETSGFTQHEMTVVKYVSKVLQEKNI
jgi:hypothetical protein